MASTSDQAVSEPGMMRRGWRTQRRVIGALMMRELHTRYGRENIGYLWIILEPLLLATMIGIIHSRAANHFGSDIKPVPLTIVGYCNFIVFRTLVSRSEGAIEGNVNLLYHRTISVMDIMLSRALLEIAGCWMAFIILISMTIALGISELPARPLLLLLGMVLLALLSFNVSLIIAAATHDNKAIGRLVHPITYILMPLSGAFFTMEMVPQPFRDIFLYIPLAHHFELLRYGWFEAATPKYIDPLYMAEWVFGSMLIGLLLISVVRKRIHMD